MQSETDVGLIYRDFREPLKAFIGKRIRDPALTEDLLHDVFLRIHKEINSLKEQEKLAPWIYTIARNVIIDFYRKRRESEQPSENLVDEQQMINDIPERLAPIIRGMIDQLPKMYRQALILADMEGIKQKEIAAKLGISVSGAKSRVQRARKMLKDLLLECCHFEFDLYGTVFDYYPKSCSQCCENENCK
ncbi:RNA polymerase sigma factor SigZ [bacterium]|nr:RNA polymerase sigma factor SigZ [bacterium]